MSDVVVSALNVTKRYGRRNVLDGVSLTVAAGEAVALVGENGAGKTTLLGVCAGLVSPDAGRVAVQGRIGWCPQQPAFLDLLGADEHLILFGRACGLNRESALAEGHTRLDEVGFSDDRRRPVRHLSGGTRQKLNLALALVGDRSVLLLDEPYQGFDRGSYVSFWDHVDGWRAAGKAVVVVTHMLAELNRVDRVVELTRADR